MIQGIIANRFAVATPHAQAAIAARKILDAGGNAIDAAAAAMLTLCVVTPSQVGLGGYGGNLVAYLAKGKRVVSLDFDSCAPLAYRDDLFAKSGAADLGYLAITVPAVVAGIDMALREFGTLGWSIVCDHAASLAENGFELDPTLKKHTDAWATKTDPISRRALFADGKVPEVGEKWVQKDLGRLIRRIGAEGIESFYRGDIPRRIVEQIREHEGILREEDFAQYRPQRVEAVTINYRGYDLYTPPPPSGGVSTLQILKVLEHFELSKLTPWSTEYFHLLTEATKLCWQDRIASLGDPDFVKMPIEQMLSEKTAAAKAQRIREGLVRDTKPVPPGGAHTANISVVDADRNVVSMTATQGFLFGSQVVIDGLGMVMGHGMSRFDFVPGHPNAPRPGKRMFHNMAPTIGLHNGRPFCAVGLPGGSKIVTVTAQLLINLIDFHTAPAETVIAPRIHSEGDEPIAISSRVTDATAGELRQMGHQIIRGQTVGGPPAEIASIANAVAVDLKSGKISAASGGGDLCVSGD